MDVTALAVATRLPEQRQVAGRIELVTESPVPIPHPDSLRLRLDEELNRRPWVVPSVLLLVIALLIVRRAR